MVSEFSEKDNEAAMSTQCDLFEECGKKRRFSLVQEDEPSSTTATKEMRRSYYDTYYNYDDYLLDDDTVKVEMSVDEENSKTTVTKGGRGRPLKQNDSHVWSDEATETLIYLWNQKEELFQKQHPHFYVQEAKERAVECIRQSLHEQGHTATSNQILSKFQSLRTYFCAQRNKLINAKKKKKKNAGGEEVESKWRFYKDLMFLDQNMKPREKLANKIQQQSRDAAREITRLGGNNGHENCSENYSMVVVGSHLNRESVSVPEYINSQDIVTNGRINSAPKEMSSPSSRNEDLLFGELVGNMMTRVPSSQRKDNLKLEIQQLIIKHKYSLASNETHHNDSPESSSKS